MTKMSWLSTVFARGLCIGNQAVLSIILRATHADVFLESAYRYKCKYMYVYLYSDMSIYICVYVYSLY